MTRWPELNLATKPFVNRRPALRLAILLWIVGFSLTAANLMLYLRQLPGASLTPEQQRQVREEIAAEGERIVQVRRDLARYDPAHLSRLVAFVNARIEARAFAWSALFDHLAEAMPGDVRLVGLEPEFMRSRTRERRSGGESAGGVLLQIRGVARTTTELLDFVDRLFAHPHFRSANLLAQRTAESGEQDFTLSVVYDPSPAPSKPGATPAPPAPAEASEEGAGEASAPEDEAPDPATGAVAP
jgi:Tfp pilus assembly protein PilN